MYSHIFIEVPVNYLIFVLTLVVGFNLMVKAKPKAASKKNELQAFTYKNKRKLASDGYNQHLAVLDQLNSCLVDIANHNNLEKFKTCARPLFTRDFNENKADIVLPEFAQMTSQVKLVLYECTMDEKSVVKSFEKDIVAIVCFSQPHSNKNLERNGIFLFKIEDGRSRIDKIR